MTTASERRYAKAQAELKEAFNALPPCDAVIYHGPGHQSKSHCTRRGPHPQHAYPPRDLYWSKKKDYSGFFDESPEVPV